MLKVFDTQCTKCNNIQEQFKEDSEEFDNCESCGNSMKRVYTRMTFKLLYDPKKDMVSWANEGYATSQYWKDVKKLRDEGHDVKGAEEKD